MESINMTCMKARKILMESGRLQDVLVELHVLAERHVEECHECKQFFQQQEDLRLPLVGRIEIKGAVTRGLGWIKNLLP